MGLIDATERASQGEMSAVSALSVLFQDWPLTTEEKLASPALFMRRQELSYILANYEIFKRVANVKGSIFYFGVYHGAGMMAWANLSAALEPFNHTREVVGFDTFEGYPEIGDADKAHGKDFRTLVKGGFNSSSQEYLTRLFELYDGNRPLSHIPKLSLVKGDVVETLPRYLAENQHTLVSVMVLTMNLYTATKAALQAVLPRMPVGAAVVIHSLNESYYPGATRALLEAMPGARIETFPYAPNLAFAIKDRSHS